MRLLKFVNTFCKIKLLQKQKCCIKKCDQSARFISVGSQEDEDADFCFWCAEHLIDHDFDDMVTSQVNPSLHCFFDLEGKIQEFTEDTFSIIRQEIFYQKQLHVIRKMYRLFKKTQKNNFAQELPQYDKKEIPEIKQELINENKKAKQVYRDFKKRKIGSQEVVFRGSWIPVGSKLFDKYRKKLKELENKYNRP